MRRPTVRPSWREAVLAATALLLAGCASVSDVLPAEGDQYRVTAHARAKQATPAQLKAMATKRAAEYCADRKLSFEVSNVEANAENWNEQVAEVTFRCPP